MEIDDSIKAAIGVKDDEKVIRVHNSPIVFAFNTYGSIEEILVSDYIDETFYVVVRDNEIVSLHQLREKLEVMDLDLENSLFRGEEPNISVLLNNDITAELPEGTTVLDVYYLWGETNHQGSALYYKTDKGDFVYYKYYLTGGRHPFFTASAFFDIMREIYGTMGPDTPPGGG